MHKAAGARCVAWTGPSLALAGAVKTSVPDAKVVGAVSGCSSVLGAPSLSVSQIAALKLTVPLDSIQTLPRS